MKRIALLLVIPLLSGCGKPTTDDSSNNADVTELLGELKAFELFENDKWVSIENTCFKSFECKFTYDNLYYIGEHCILNGQYIGSYIKDKNKLKCTLSHDSEMTQEYTFIKRNSDTVIFDIRYINEDVVYRMKSIRKYH